MKTRLAVVAVLLCLGVAAQSAPVLWSGNGHYYETVSLSDAIAWQSAKAAAQARTYLGVTGHLATITSAAEQQFVYSNLLDGTSYAAWLGGYQDPETPPPASHWHWWITGEPWDYTNWNSGEPNDFPYPESYLIIFASGLYSDRLKGRWNDFQADGTDNFGNKVTQYMVEYPVPEPSSLLGLTGALGCLGVAVSRVSLRNRRRA